MTAVLPHGPGKEDTTEHDGDGTGAAAGLEEPAGIAQHQLTPCTEITSSNGNRDFPQLAAGCGQAGAAAAFPGCEGGQDWLVPGSWALG